MLYSFRRIIIIAFGLVFFFALTRLYWKVSWRPKVKSPRPLSYHYGSGFTHEMILSKSCEEWINNKIAVTVPALLIDEEILKHLIDNNCSQVVLKTRVKIAVNKKLRGTFEEPEDSLQVVFFESNAKKDYLEFHVNLKETKIIPKNFPSQVVNNLTIPTQIPLFLEFWRRGTFVNCKNMTMNRDSPRNKYIMFFRNFLFPPRKPIPALESVKTLAKLRDEMLQFGIFPFLNGGTFLGWYRECSVIPHTTDMDIAIFEENWNKEFYEFLWSYNTTFKVKRQLGLVNDSYELTIVPKNGFKTPIDLFLMYKNLDDGKENRWVGGLTTAGVKYKYIYPSYDPWCAADLMGHIFWVTCTPEEKIEKEYGDYWYLDENSSKYIWNAARNSVENGRFTKHQMETETYNEYIVRE